jgi:ABC-type sugar transport system ATPase subunit
MSKPLLMELIVGDHAPAGSARARHSLPGSKANSPAGSPKANSRSVLAVRALRVVPRSAPATFEIRAGEIVGLAGLVGSGRSRLLRILAGAQQPVGGRIALSGQELRTGSVSHARRAGIVLIGEDRLAQGLVDTLSVATNMSLGRSGTGWRERALVRSGKEGAIATDWIERLKIRGATPEGSVMQLSGGNQQKVLFARALACRPCLLLLDEPTRGVDVGSREQLYSIVSDFANAGGAVLTAMSDLDELASFVTSALILREGSIVSELPPGSVSRARILEACYGHQ